MLWFCQNFFKFIFFIYHNSLSLGWISVIHDYQPKQTIPQMPLLYNRPLKHSEVTIKLRFVSYCIIIITPVTVTVHVIQCLLFAVKKSRKCKKFLKESTCPGPLYKPGCVGTGGLSRYTHHLLLEFCICFKLSFRRKLQLLAKIIWCTMFE